MARIRTENKILVKANALTAHRLLSHNFILTSAPRSAGMPQCPVTVSNTFNRHLSGDNLSVHYIGGPLLFGKSGWAQINTIPNV